MGASGVISSNTTYSAPPAVSASVRSFSRPSLAITPSVTMSIFVWPNPATAWPSRPLEPGPTSSVGCGMGTKRSSLPAPFIMALRPRARVDAGMKSKFTGSLLGAQQTGCGKWVHYGWGSVFIRSGHTRRVGEALRCQFGWRVQVDYGSRRRVQRSPHGLPGGGYQSTRPRRGCGERARASSAHRRWPA